VAVFLWFRQIQLRNPSDNNLSKKKTKNKKQKRDIKEKKKGHMML